MRGGEAGGEGVGRGGKLYTGGCRIVGSACRPCKPPFPAVGYCQHHRRRARHLGKVCGGDPCPDEGHQREKG